MGVIRQAAIDCGTNSIRLLVADFDEESKVLDPLWRDMRIVRLGEGVDASGELSAAAIGRVLLATKLFAQVLDDLGSPPVVFAATSATRDARNADRLAAGIEAIVGVAPQVISGTREAVLSFLGATWDLPSNSADPVLVFDIGGGSTEIIRGGPDARVVAGAVSVDLGCVRMAERHRDLARPSHLGPGIHADVAAALTRARAEVPLAGAGTVVGLSGTVTTVAAIALGLDSYNPALVHHARISAERVHEVGAMLAAMTPAQIADLPAMHPGRSDVIVAGAVILGQLLEATGAQELLVSEADILDGLVLDALGQA